MIAPFLRDYMKNSSVWDTSKMVGLWRIIVVHNIPYTDPRRNGKVSLLFFLILIFIIIFLSIKPVD